MVHVLILAALATIVYALVNAFGAWAVVRRKSWVAALFMASASLLVVSAVALAYSLPAARILLGLGLVLASITSLLNAGIVLGRVVWSFHLLRALIAALIFALASLGLPW